MSPSSLAPFWKTPDASEKVNCLCFGTGRFLRSVLVPALQEMGEDCYHPPALIQPRGSSFLEYMQQQQELGSYEVDTVLESGTVQTDRIPCSGAFSLGTEAAQAATWEFIASLQQPIRLIGVGVTEAGLASPDTQAMKDLMELLRQLAQKQFISSEDGADDDKICIVDMDNVPNNGDRIHSHLVDLAASDDNMQQFLQKHVVCLNTMVDRITSARPDSNGMVPRAEPLPAKALVVLDVDKVLPSTFGTVLGVVVRSSRTQLDADIALKLRIANGTHTAVAHALALQKMLMTDVLGLDKVVNSLWMESYLESVVHDQILTAAEPLYGKEESAACWDDWKKRLIHPHFGLSSFFITQNSASKAGIRWGPTVVNLLAGNKKVTVGTVFAYAALIRWLTPVRSSSDGRMVGWLDGAIPIETMGSEDDTDTTTSYADGLRYNLKEGWYEFKCSCILGEKTFSECLLKLARADAQPATYYDIFSVYLVAKDGGDLSSVSETSGFPVLVAAISTLVARMVAGDRLGDIMVEMQSFQGVFVDGFATDCQVLLDGSLTWAAEPHPTVLHFESSPVPDKSCLMQRVVGASSVESVIMSEVAAAEAIDLHTHLLPPTHGPLCSWGIDELLTYHYLVAEYFITAPADISPEEFYKLTKQAQADLIWKALFVDRLPVSEACRGVLTTVKKLGIEDIRDLSKIRNFYATYRDRGLDGAEEFSESVYKLAGIRYAIMTNVPFNSSEAHFWKPIRAEYSTRYRSALRVDPLLAGDRSTIEASLQAGGYPLTTEGAKQYLRDWCDVMKPEYMMASTPHDFVLKEGTLTGIQDRSVNVEAMKVPGAFAAASYLSETACPPQEEDTPSVIDESSDFLSQVLMEVCEELDLPLALKIGAHRGVNTRLQAAGDGVVAFADAGVLSRLCTRFPKVRFLATFLSRNNQHEACVLASKFRNLHIYGCWWFCNNPSMIREITQMRVEMLGTAFTAQHSDARVLDQLVYKWSHSRAVIATVLVQEYHKLVETGWKPTRAEIRRDIGRLFGGSYEEFMTKSFTWKNKLSSSE